jgi:hypothetical protein
MRRLRECQVPLIVGIDHKEKASNSLLNPAASEANGEPLIASW